MGTPVQVEPPKSNTGLMIGIGAIAVGMIMCCCVVFMMIYWNILGPLVGTRIFSPTP